MERGLTHSSREQAVSQNFRAMAVPCTKARSVLVLSAAIVALAASWVAGAEPSDDHWISNVYGLVEAFDVRLGMTERQVLSLWTNTTIGRCAGGSIIERTISPQNAAVKAILDIHGTVTSINVVFRDIDNERAASIVSHLKRKYEFVSADENELVRGLTNYLFTVSDQVLISVHEIPHIDDSLDMEILYFSVDEQRKKSVERRRVFDSVIDENL